MTSIALELAFSTGGRILNNYRTRMKADTLEALVCAQDWICGDVGIHDDDQEVENDEISVIE
jgi:hypothetical protein